MSSWRSVGRARMGSKDVTSFVKVSPSETVTLKPHSSVEISLENTGKKTVAYKLKTTRPATVKPEKTFGSIKKGETEKVKFQFKPKKDEKPFLSEDRITIVLTIMPEKFTVSALKTFRLGPGWSLEG